MQRFSFPFGPFSIALALGSGLLLLPETAAAQSHGATVGITMSFSLGVRPAMGIGLDLRYSYYIPTQQHPSLGDVYFPLYDYASTGAFAQIAYLRGGAFRIAAGAHGGDLPYARILGFDGELGIAYRSRSKEGSIPAGVGLHLGVLPTITLIYAETGPSIRGSIGLSKHMGNEIILGWDIRGPGPCFFVECVLFPG